MGFQWYIAEIKEHWGNAIQRINLWYLAWIMTQLFVLECFRPLARPPMSDTKRVLGCKTGSLASS